MINIDGHTFDQTKLNGGWVVDAGCRGFNFTNYCIDMCKVYALDIEDFASDPSVPIVGKYFSTFILKQAALTNRKGHTEAYFFGNGTGNFIQGVNQLPGNTPDRPCETKVIPCITLEDIYNEIGTDIDVLKLDIEGAEYQVLENIAPIPRQITVEFHEHCHDHLHRAYIEKVMTHLLEYYNCSLNLQQSERYKYLDCLFIRKDLI